MPVSADEKPRASVYGWLKRSHLFVLLLTIDEVSLWIIVTDQKGAFCVRRPVKRTLASSENPSRMDFDHEIA